MKLKVIALALCFTSAVALALPDGAQARWGGVGFRGAGLGWRGAGLGWRGAGLGWRAAAWRGGGWGWRGRGWGWGGVGLGLGLAAATSPWWYGSYGSDCSYYGYGYGCPSYSYGYGYPSYAWGGTGWGWGGTGWGWGLTREAPFWPPDRHAGPGAVTRDRPSPFRPWRRRRRAEERRPSLRRRATLCWPWLRLSTFRRTRDLRIRSGCAAFLALKGGLAFA